MQKIMNDTYPGIAIEAITNGFEGSWERLIAKKLFDKAASSNVFIMMEAHSILKQTGCKVWDEEACLKSAYLITGSTPEPKAEEPAKPLPLIVNNEIDLGRSFEKLKEALNESEKASKESGQYGYVTAYLNLKIAVRNHVYKCTGEVIGGKLEPKDDPNGIPDELYQLADLKRNKE
jgi:hypothetical protein